MDTPNSNSHSSARKTPRSSFGSAQMTPSSSSSPSTQSASNNYANCVFNPLVKCSSGKSAHVGSLLHFDGKFTYIRTSANTKQIIVAIGGCRYNRLRNATASIGVYFGPGASTNIKDVLEENDFGRPFFVEANRYKVRSEFAQLMACYHALHAVQQSYFQKVFADDHGNGNLSQVVIKTDSTELFHGMTRLIFGWEQTNWKEKGKPVPHSEIFKEIQHLVAELNNVEVQVLFWKVMRDNNDKAHDLARQALTERFGRNAIKSRPPLSPATLQRRDERARRVLGLAPI